MSDVEVPAASPDSLEPAPDAVPAGPRDTASVLERARGWLAQDPDSETRAELRDLIAAVEAGEEYATADLEDRFSERLAFGTAGLRGELGAGSNRMNRVLVAQAAAGLAAYLQATSHTDAAAGAEPPADVFGYDGSRNSRVFARD